ncbi:glycosyltransferase family 2 protein [uncultured Fibrobacter sp.]|uniref:glycosyltransferase family 2 protein n=1 Tax=uncultured Fibrobacter sp. TaxID=261512 RepID=UPI00262C8949|nr:glycosyltransferase family 2 protein [uncultured Fibrobacter sp.]
MYGLVSIIMPSYNTAPFIADSIRSVLAQTYSNWELIIVDDASPDNTTDVVNRVIQSGFNDMCHSELYETKNFSSQVELCPLGSSESGVEGSNFEKRIHYIKNRQNSGAAFSRNRALREAKGKWIAFLDSDDLWTPDKLEKQLAFMTANNYAFSYTRYEEIDENGKPLGIVVGGPKHISKMGMYNYCWPGCLTVMYNREVVGDIQIANIQKNNDYAMWLKVCRKAECHLLSENLALYRQRDYSISSHGYFYLIKWHYKLFRNAEGMNVVCSLLNTIRNIFFGVWKKIRYVRRG